MPREAPSAPGAAPLAETSPAVDPPSDDKTDFNEIVQAAINRQLGAWAADRPDTAAAVIAGVIKKLPSTVEGLARRYRIDSFAKNRLKKKSRRQPPLQDEAVRKLCNKLQHYKSDVFKQAQQLVEVCEHMRRDSIDLLNEFLREHGQMWIELAESLGAPKSANPKAKALPDGTLH
jgi:hypothetical protein